MDPAIAPQFPISIASLSLGRAPHHDLAEKIHAASAAGFQGIELYYEDIELHAKQSSDGSFEENILKSAQVFKDLCDECNLKVIVLQPFTNYDGLLDPAEHAQQIDKIKLWFKIAKVVGTDLILVTSNFFSEGTTGDDDRIVADLLEIVELGEKENPPVRFAYEAISWGARKNTWQQTWKIVKKANRPNLGLCLDTFHIVARTWADVTRESGVRPNANKALAADLKECAAEVPLDKIFLVQLSDAERLHKPLDADHEWYSPDYPPDMIWSRNARIFPYETDRNGYFPIEKIVRSWVNDWGYRGWMSYELYHRDLYDPSPSVPQEFAERGMKSWGTMVQRLELDKIGSETR
ncbi:xylose isomerase-like protein [Lipomyces orientalis]|uniref:Xylose isomerase-like protein n=1 Tax=Lipomyces orientalis TaxID=1233043 RepID=A0ACC3TEL4_9ASCO